MPALNTTIPAYPRSLDLRDAVDGVDRKLESALAAAVLVQQVLRDIVVDPATGTTANAGEMPRPSFITSSGGVTSYESDMSDALTKVSEVVADLLDYSSLT